MKYMNQTDLTITHYVASCFLPPEFKHSHDFFELSFCLHGQSINIINDKPIQFERGKIAILRPKDNHYFKILKNKTQYEHKDIYVTQSRFQEICNTINPDLYNEIIDYPEPIYFNASEEFLNYIWQKSLLLSEVLQKNEQYISILHANIITSILCQWFESSLIVEQKFPQWLNDLLPQFHSATFLPQSISEIAKSVGYTPPYFSNVFKKYMNITAVKYLNKKRLIFSKQLLYENKMNIIDIAMLLGFANSSAYSKQFLKEFGLTPSEYRKKSLTTSISTSKEE